MTRTDPAEGIVAADGTQPPALPRGPVRVTLAIACALILTGMTVLTVVDVIGRYAFNSPVLGGSEVTEILLVCVVYIGLVAVCLDRMHVTVDLIVERLPRRWQRPRELFVKLVSGVVLLVVGWRLWAYGSQMAGYGGQTNTLGIPVGPVAWFCAICTFVAAAVTLWPDKWMRKG